MADKTLEELKAEHGQIATVTLGGTKFHFRTPSIGEYHRVNQKAGKKNPDYFEALRELVLSCSVGPDPIEAFKRKPGAIGQIGDALMGMAGSEVEVTVSKD